MRSALRSASITATPGAPSTSATGTLNSSTRFCEGWISGARAGSGKACPRATTRWVGTGFPKRSCSNKKIERDDDSKKSHPALGLRVRRQRGAAVAKRALHHHGVEPAAEFEADAGVRSDHLEAGPGMDADRSGVGGIADHRNHLAIASRFGFGDQRLQQLQADPAPMDCGLKVN